MERGYLIVHSRVNPLGAAPILRYTWHGGDVIEISGNVWPEFSQAVPKIGTRLWIGPYCARVLEYRFAHDSVLVCRERPVITALRVAFYRGNVYAEMAYRRLVLTLAVWGLASYQQGRLPSWRDIYVLAPLARWHRKRQARKLAATLDRVNRSFTNEE